VYAALTKAADTARADGDERGRGQVMADTLVARVTGRESGQTPVEIQLVMSDTTLLHGGTAPADIVSYGPLPEPVVRSVLARLNPETEIWLRRLYADPDTGELVAMESKRRLFPEPLRRFLLVRDQLCRTPWCGAPVRHADHVVPRQRGGPTSVDNGQGLCERCNQIKESAGWRAGTQPDGTVVTTTPTGHSYASTVPRLLDFVSRLRIEIPRHDAA
jgi:hypothetical protein